MDVEFSTYVFSGINVGDNVTYTCNNGYVTPGQGGDNTSVAYCSTNGNWTDAPTCIGV